MSAIASAKMGSCFAALDYAAVLLDGAQQVAPPVHKGEYGKRTGVCG